MDMYVTSNGKRTSPQSLNCRALHYNETKFLSQDDYLTTIAGPWYFGRVLVPLRLKNQSLYHKILLLQKFNDISGKVLKPKKIQPPTSKK